MIRHRRLITYLFLYLIILTPSPFWSDSYCQTWIHNGPSGDFVEVIEIAEYDSSFVFVGTRSNGIFRCEVGTWEWTECNNGLPLNIEGDYFNGDYPKINQIVTAGNSPDKIWVGTDHFGLF